MDPVHFDKPIARRAIHEFQHSLLSKILCWLLHRQGPISLGARNPLRLYHVANQGKKTHTEKGLKTRPDRIYTAKTKINAEQNLTLPDLRNTQIGLPRNPTTRHGLFS